MGTFIRLPGPCFVHQLQWDVTTAEGGTLTFDIGDSDDPDGWVDGADGNAVASAVSTLITAGEYYSADQAFVFTNVNAADTAVIAVRLIVSDLRLQT